MRALYLVSIRGAWFFEHLTTEPLRYQRWAVALLDGLFFRSGDRPLAGMV